MTTTNFAYTGAAQSFTVPAFVYSIDVKLRGALATVGLYGGYVELTIPVLPGDVVQINCGGQPSGATGGWNGGGNGGSGFQSGFGGAGATDIRIGGTGAANRIAVAGGSGGIGGNSWSQSGGAVPGGGGAGGGVRGGDGQPNYPFTSGGGSGGDQTPPGSIAAQNGGNGVVVSGHQGGGGGGAGGGYNHGGGGAGGSSSNVCGTGGGGGSGFCSATSPRGATSNPVNQANDSTANGAGSASITYIVATPTAPTPVSPLSNADRDASLAITLRAQFNSPSPASHVVSASFRYKAAGAGSWTTVAADTIADPIVSYTVTAGSFTPDVAIEWQAQTTDNAGNTGPWSSSWFFTPRAVPSAPTITAPTAGATINDLSASPITISATTGQTDTEFRRTGDLAGVPDPNTVYEDSGPLAVSTLTHNFTNGATHPVGTEHWQARVRTNSTLWSAWGDVTVDAEIMAPPVPLLTLTLLDTPAVQIQIVNPAPTGGQSAADHTDLYRTGPDGNRIRIAADLAANGVVTDWWPGAGDNDYQAVAYSANGASAGSA